MYRGFGGQQRSNRFEPFPNNGGRDNRGGGGRFGQNDRDRFNSSRGGPSSNRGGGSNSGSFRGGSTGNQPPSRSNNDAQGSGNAGNPTPARSQNAPIPSGGGNAGPNAGGSAASSSNNAQSGASTTRGANISTVGAVNASAGNTGAPGGQTGTVAATPAVANEGSKNENKPNVVSGNTAAQQPAAATPSTSSLPPRPNAPASVNTNLPRGGNAPAGGPNSAGRGGGDLEKREPIKREGPESKPFPQQQSSPQRPQPPQNQQQRDNQQQQRGGNAQQQNQQRRETQQQQRGGNIQQQQRNFQQQRNQNQYKSETSFDDTKASMDAEEGKQEEEEKVPVERKFTGRCRLFVGNMPSDTTEEDFVKMFEQFGETNEAFLNAARGFGFIRLDTRHNAENARRALDGVQRRGRSLRVRFAAHGAALRVKYLSLHVSNEMLAQTFSMFGDVERAVVVVDDRGKPNGEGIVEFARKPGALAALKRISEGVFLMTSSLRPIMVEPLEDKDENDGLPEAFFQQTADLIKERELPPRFAQPNSVEFEFGQKWKTLYQMYKEREELLRRNFEEEAAKLDMDQETAKLEQHAAMLRQDLMRRQEELRRLEEQTQKEVQRRLEQRMMEDERRRKDQEMMDARRRQGDMFQQQHQSIQQQVQQHQQEWQQKQLQQQQLQQQQVQQQHMRDMRGGGDRGGLSAPMQPPPVPPGIGGSMEQRARAQGINVIGGGGGPGQPIGAAMAAGGSAIPSLVQQELAVAPQGNLRQIRYEPQPGMGPNGGAGMVREIGAKAGQGMAGGGREEYFDPKRARRY